MDSFVLRVLRKLRLSDAARGTPAAYLSSEIEVPPLSTEDLSGVGGLSDGLHEQSRIVLPPKTRNAALTLVLE